MTSTARPSSSPSITSNCQSGRCGESGRERKSEMKLVELFREPGVGKGDAHDVTVKVERTVFDEDGPRHVKGRSHDSLGKHGDLVNARGDDCP